MQKLLMVLLCAVSILPGCSKSDNSHYKLSQFKVEINGSVVQYDSVGIHEDPQHRGTYYLSFRDYEGSTTLQSSLVVNNFSIVERGPQILRYTDWVTPRFGEASSYISRLIGGDVICELYRLDETDSSQNYITITQYNAVTNRVRGFLNAKYRLQGNISSCSNAPADSVKLVKASFTAIAVHL